MRQDVVWLARGPRRAGAVAALAALGLLAATGAAGADGVGVRALTADHQTGALGADPARRPRLAWELRSSERSTVQTDYQVQVATSSALLRGGTPDVWDSGRVASAQSVDVRYAGPSLQPRTRYFWRVRAWTNKGASAWSRAASWETALAPANWTAQWITVPDRAAATPIAQLQATGAWDFGSAATRMGQTFRADGAFATVSGNFTEFSSHYDTAITLNLRSGGLSGAIVASRRFENVVPGQWLAIEAAPGASFPAGDYYVEATGQEARGDGKLGWFATVNDVYAGGAAYRDGSPLGGDLTFRVDSAPKPATQLRKDFTLARPVVRARAYATALGLHELRLNGRRVSDDLLAPDWTDYTRRVKYQVYDVTKLIRSGANTVGAVVAPGWYSGTTGILKAFYGSHTSLRVQLELTHADGSTTTVVTDPTWKGTGDGPVRFADIYDGESYDARKETPGWDAPGFDASQWQTAQVSSDPNTRALLVPQVAPVTRPLRRYRPVAIRGIGNGRWIVDFGRNLVGAVELRVNGAAGTTVKLRHSPELNADGTLKTDFLRSAEATDQYTLKGQGVERYQPRFTFHGFRYVEVSGFPGTPTNGSLTAVQIQAAGPDTGSFETSDEHVNELQEAIDLTERGHLIAGVANDTPERDERLGWADQSLFVETAEFNADNTRLYSDWLDVWRDEQLPSGELSAVNPLVPYASYGGHAYLTQTVAHLAWTAWQRRGDTSLAEANYPAAKKWIDYLITRSPGNLPTGIYGDLWALDTTNPQSMKNISETAFYARGLREVAELARLLGHTADAQRYGQLFADTRAAFTQAFVLPDGRMTADSQGAYVLALAFDLVPAARRQALADRLVALIRGAGGHLLTGYAGAPYAMQVLADTGYQDVAEQLVMTTSYPSWGWMLDEGATTFWEHWDSIRPDGSYYPANGNSFNHTPLANFGDWLYGDLGGLRTDPAAPGYRNIIVRPRISERFEWVKTRYRSRYGTAAVRWKQDDERLSMKVTVPPNATATVHVPAAAAADVLEDGAPAVDGTDVRLDPATGNGVVVLDVGSGTYRFSVERDSVPEQALTEQLRPSRNAAPLRALARAAAAGAPAAASGVPRGALTPFGTVRSLQAP